MAKNSWDFDTDTMWAHYEKAVENETLRGMALIHGAMIEDAITRLLQAYLVPGAPTREMFKDFNSSAGTWSSKTSLAYAVGLITEDEARATDLLRNIRNEFTHSLTPKIEEASILNRLDTFTRRIGGHEVIPLKTKYQMLVSYLASSFFNRLDEIGDGTDVGDILVSEGLARKWPNGREFWC